jgi:hypothetical protein
MQSALILVLVIGLLPFFVRELRKSKMVLLAYWFVIALHQVVAFTNIFLFRTLGSEADADKFHRIAVQLAGSGNFEFSNGAILYRNILGIIYWLLSPSKLLGSQFSILMFALSCIVLLKILCLMGLGRYRASVLLVFGALPSMVFMGSIPLRESYEIFFFMLAVYFGMKIYEKKSVSRNFFLMLVSTALMGVLHPALKGYAIFMGVLFMVWTPTPSSSLLMVRRKSLMIALTMLFLLTAIIFAYKSGHIHLGSFDAVPDLGLLGVVSKYRALKIHHVATAASRAFYLVPMDLSSPFTTVYTFSSIYIHYLFAPFLWQIKSMTDVGGFLESMSRMVLIIFSVKHWYQAHGLQRRFLGLMLILFFSMTFLWSVGTSNYGTAMRHNLLSWWILSIAGTPLLVKMLSRFRERFSQP